MKWKTLNVTLCLALLLLAVSCTRGKRATSGVLEMGEEAADRLAVNVILMLDDSGSMANADPGNLRLEAARRIALMIGKDKALTRRTGIGLIRFGDDAQVMVPISGAPAVEGAMSGLRLSPSGNTNLLAAFRAGYQAFLDADTCSERKPVLLFLTDGSPWDKRKLKETGAYFLELRAFIEENLRRRGCGIYVVGINSIDEWGHVERYWRETADGVYQMEEKEQFGNILEDILQQIYGIPAATREIVRPGQPLVFTIPPYTGKLEAHILPQEESGHLMLHKPDGSAVEDEGSILRECDSYRSLRVEEPVPGDWLLEAEEGEFAVYHQLIPYRLELVKPADIHPLGKPMRIEVAFLKSNNQPVEELSRYKLRFSGQVTMPGSSLHGIEFEAIARGRYQAKSALIPDEEGTCKVVLTAQGGAAFCSETVETITVKSMPYLMITNPVSHCLQPGDLAVTAAPFQAGKQLTGQEVRAASVLARLCDPSGRVSTTWLELEPDGQSAVLSGVFPGALKQEGQYRLVVEAVDLVAGADDMLFHARRGFLSRLYHRAIYGVTGLSCFLVTVFIICLMQARHLPKITGSISAYEGDVFLKQKRVFRKGWVILRLSRRKKTCGRWFLITGAPPGGDAWVNVLFRSGLMFTKRRLYQSSALELGTHTLRYA